MPSKKPMMKRKHVPSKKLFEFTTEHGNSFPFFVADPIDATAYFARGFHEAAKKMTEVLKRGDFPDYEALPVVFLYRHAVELALKGLIWQADQISIVTKTRKVSGHAGPAKADHKITPLLPFVKHVIREFNFRWDEKKYGPSSEACSILKDLDHADPDSFKFRYPMTKIHRIRQNSASTFLD